MTRRTVILARCAWIAATLILAALWRPEALCLLAALPAIGPVLREIRPGSAGDERERLVDYRASHIALVVTYALLAVLFLRAALATGAPPAELFLLLAVPLLVRVVLSVGQGAGARRLGLVLGFGCGAIWTGFTFVSHGLSIETLVESAVGGGILAATALALRWPRLGGAVLIALGLVFLALFVVSPLSRQEWTQSLLMAVALPAPPLVAGLALFGSALRGAAGAADEFEDFRRPAGR